MPCFVSHSGPVHGFGVVASSLVPPALFKEQLKSKDATEGGAAILCCQLTKATPVAWKKGERLLKESDKYKMRQEGCLVQLAVQDVELEDAAQYT